MKPFIAWFLSISGAWVAGAVFLVPALETALLLGLMIPGEVTVILGGVVAAEGDVPLWAILVASAAGAMTGDAVGFALGRRWGRVVVRKKAHKRWSRARRWLSGRSGWKIFLGRFLPFLRSVLPTSAGALRIEPRRYLGWDLPAAAIWSSASVLLGYFGARDIGRILELVHRSALVAGALVLLLGAFFLWRTLRPRRRTTAATT